MNRVAGNLIWRRVNRVGMCDNGINMKTFLLFSLSFILVVMCSCRGKTSSDITKEEVEKVINEKNPVGTSKSDVMAFLNTLKIGSRSVEGIKYLSGRSEASYVEDSQPPNVYGYIWAVILKAGNTRVGFLTTSYYFTMYFYFDENEKLIGYHVQPLLDA
jgi:hypothetical protein